jgi:hypothetical protein
MITTDLTAFKSSLEEAKSKITKGLESMIETLMYSIAVEAIDNTPYGQDNELYSLKSRAYAGLYPEPGHAKGGWQVVTGKYLPTSSRAFRKTYPARSESAFDVKDYADIASSKYKLGDTIMVVNSVPYLANDGFSLPWMKSIESGYSDQAPNGVMAPTLSAVQSIYLKNLADYYVKQ